MGRRKRDKYKTKAQLLEELTELRERVAELEAENPNGEGDPNGDGDPSINGNIRGDTPPTEMLPLHRLAERVEHALRHLVPEEVDIRLCTEERLGMVHADPGVAEQLVVQLFLTRSKPRARP